MHTAKLLLASALLLPACGGGESASIGVGPGGGSAETPDGTLELAFDHLENKRISSFLMLMAPPPELQRMKDEWAEMQRKPLEQAEDAQFRQMMGMLTADGAEDTLFAMVQPNLAEAQKQIGMVAGMAPMMAAGAIQESGAPADTLVMVETIGAKLAGIDIANEKKAKKAIAIVCKAARKIDVKSGAEMQKLSFEQAMKKADIAYAGVVDALAVYGLDFDETFESLEARVLSTAGDTAEVEVSVSLFGLEKKTVPVTMERKAGRWYPKKDEAESAPGMAR
ncbi:MAG: hypothetical protein AAF957_09595 [Planctomycetota bacterium]